MLSVVLLLSALSLVSAQQVGTNTPEDAPAITYQTCTTAGGCTTKNATVTLEAAWRWIHNADLVTCDPDGFNLTICPDEVTCAENCFIEGVSLADYNATYGISTSGDAVNLVFGSGGNRAYLFDTETGNYTNFLVLNQEFTFDVQIQNIPCGYNAALYFSEMQLNGGLGTLNKAGAKYGTGYCDSQCGTGTDFFDDHVNWNGTLGSCCNEMDIWEANFESTQLTPHPCTVVGNIACTGSECDSVCDPSGCDYNPFRLGNQQFYGPGLQVNTNETFTVVTQFITNDSTPTGTLSEIRRIYVQNGVVIQNAPVNLAVLESELAGVNYISQDFCTDKINTLYDAASFNTYGGLAGMGESLSRGAVLIFALWDSLGSGMDWLDGLEGTDPTSPGALRGNCTDAEAVSDSLASVTFSNIKVGDLNSTYPAGSGGSTTTSSSSSSSTTTTSSSTSSAPQSTQTHWGQCAGIGYTGPTVCATGFTCQEQNAYYSQCL